MTTHKRVMFTNTTKVQIFGKAAGEDFFLEVSKDGTPTDFIWRKRFNDGDIVPKASETQPSKPKKKASAVNEVSGAKSKGGN